MHRFGDPYFAHGGGSALHWAIFALLLVLLLVGLALAAAAIGRRPHLAAGPAPAPPAPGGRGDDALDLLRLRYARGELGRDEYLQARDDLEPSPPPPPAA